MNITPYQKYVNMLNTTKDEILDEINSYQFLIDAYCYGGVGENYYNQQIGIKPNDTVWYDLFTKLYSSSGANAQWIVHNHIDDLRYLSMCKKILNNILNDLKFNDERTNSITSDNIIQYLMDNIDGISDIAGDGLNYKAKVNYESWQQTTTDGNVVGTGNDYLALYLKTFLGYDKEFVDKYINKIKSAIENYIENDYNYNIVDMSDYDDIFGNIVVDSIDRINIFSGTNTTNLSKALNQGMRSYDEMHSNDISVIADILKEKFLKYYECLIQLKLIQDNRLRPLLWFRKNYHTLSRFWYEQFNSKIDKFIVTNVDEKTLENINKTIQTIKLNYSPNNSRQLLIDKECAGLSDVQIQANTIGKLINLMIDKDVYDSSNSVDIVIWYREENDEEVIFSASESEEKYREEKIIIPLNINVNLNTFNSYPYFKIAVKVNGISTRQIKIKAYYTEQNVEVSQEEV